MAEYMGIDEKTIRRYLKEFKDEYKNDRGVVVRMKEKGADDGAPGQAGQELWYQRD